LNLSISAPSNIALIKYIGKASIKKPSTNMAKDSFGNFIKNLSKKDQKIFASKNLSINPSLSYTLNHFITKVEITESSKDQWSAFKKNPFKNPLYTTNKKISFDHQITISDQKKFLEFFIFLKKIFQIPGHYTIYSQNNFPLAVGAASSASSFAALTQASYQLALHYSPLKNQLKNIKFSDLALLSRLGSGSSCRSFCSPWCLWDNHKIKVFKSPWKKLEHQLVLTDLQAKKTSSRKAHEIIKTSPHFKNRSKRAKKRFLLLSEAFNLKDWSQCFKISWEEFLDMHSLFETACPPLEYQTKKSKQILNFIQHFWKKNQDGPLITMDAGASVHLLYRPDQSELKNKLSQVLSDYLVLSSMQ